MGMELIGRALTAAEWQGMRDDPALVEHLLFGDDEDEEMPEPDLDLHKFWHAIHFLLTGTAWETGPGVAAAILGGEPIGEDGGYGPARLLEPEAVRTVATALGGLDAEALRAGFDPSALTAADIYPNIWDDYPEAFDDLLPFLDQLRDFYRDAAAAGQAVLLVIT